MRFTLDLSHHAWARDATGEAATRTLQIARAADAGGIDDITVSEDPEAWDAFALLGALATATSRAKLGTSVTSPYPRHPYLLAASVATLDRLSGGRAVLGLGRGQIEWHRDALGIDTGDPVEVLRETILLLREWWAAPHRASTPPEAHFHVREWERVIHPLQKRVPVFLAAAGPKALRLAGTLCDGVIFNYLTSEESLRQAIAHARAAAVDGGRDPNQMAFVLRTTAVFTETESAEREALDRGKSFLALIATLPGMQRLVQTDGFDVPAILEEARAAMRTNEILARGGGFPALKREGDLDAARAAIPDDLIRRLGIIGSPDEVRRRLRALAEIGVTHVGVTPPRNATSSDAWRRLLRELRE
jgi:5,10-methylenetetrahydromethanopterin reductase